MAIKFFLAELFKKNLLGGGGKFAPPTKIGLRWNPTFRTKIFPKNHFLNFTFFGHIHACKTLSQGVLHQKMVISLDIEGFSGTLPQFFP